jgi:uncharacterized protein
MTSVGGTTGRAGRRSRRAPWSCSGGGEPTVPDLRILHDAGYNVLTYDLRNLGHSGAGCNATFYAMTTHPEAFDGVRCLVGPQPIVTKNVCVPTFLNPPIADKKLQWIYGTTARFDGYLEFQRRPRPMLAWFEEHMS